MRTACSLMFAALLIIGGCTMHYSKMAAPQPPNLRNEYEIINHRKESASGFRLLWLGSSAPSAMEIINQAVMNAEGDGMVNVEVSFSEAFIGPFSWPRVTVEGDVVKRMANAALNSGLNKIASAERNMPEAGSLVSTVSAPKEDLAGEVKTQQPSTNIQGAPVPDETLSSWKLEISRLYKKHAIYTKWWSYLRRTKQNMKFELWVGKLGESDYHDYAQKGLQSAEWLLTRWENEAQAFEKKRALEMNVPSPF